MLFKLRNVFPVIFRQIKICGPEAENRYESETNRKCYGLLS